MAQIEDRLCILSRTQALWNADTFIFLATKLSQISLVPRPEEEEKRSGFSRLQMCLIAVKFHSLHTPAIYFRTFMMSNFDTKHITLSVDLSWQHIMACKKLACCSCALISWSEVEVRVGWWKKGLATPAGRAITRGYLGFHWTTVCPFCWCSSLINSTRMFSKGGKTHL